jgi:hypothetical protein
MDTPLPAKVRAIDIQGQPVRLIETEGRGVWLCDCASFQARAKQSSESFCGHTAVAITRCIEDGSLEFE